MESLGVTLNFIDIYLKLFEDNYNARRVAYISKMKKMFKKIPQNMIKALTPKQKSQILMREIGGG